MVAASEQRKKNRRGRQIRTWVLAGILILLILFVYLSENPMDTGRKPEGSADYSMGSVEIDFRTAAGFAFKLSQMEFPGSTRYIPGGGNDESFNTCAKTMDCLVKNSTGKTITVTQKTGAFLDVDPESGEKIVAQNPGLCYYFYVYDVTEGQSDPAAGDALGYLTSRQVEPLESGASPQGYQDSGLTVTLEPEHTYCFKWILWVDFDTSFMPDSPGSYGLSVEAWAREAG